MTAALDLASVRARFPALADSQVAFFDGPAGSQVPQSVADAVSRYLLTTNSNRGGGFPVSQASDEIITRAHQAAAEFLNAENADSVIFGPNMTSLTFAVSRALSRTWSPGDEIITTALDHDANVTPWVLAARDAGATVIEIPFHHADCTLDVEQLLNALSPRTKLVAVGLASNAVGTVNPEQQITAAAHDVGALVYVDAVHYAPHRCIDVAALDCDFLACSAYKFCGPHVGLLYMRSALQESLEAYKVRPAPQSGPGRWMTGTANHEGIAGVLACIDYLASLGHEGDGAASRRAAIETAFSRIHVHETELLTRLLEGLSGIPGLTIHGITDPARFDDRVPTVSVTHARMTPGDMARGLAEQGLYAWHGNHYALRLSEELGLEPHGTLRLGLLHYNTMDEVERLVGALEGICGTSTSS